MAITRCRMGASRNRKDEQEAGDKDEEMRFAQSSQINLALFWSLLAYCAQRVFTLHGNFQSLYSRRPISHGVIIVDNGEAPASQTLVSVTRPIEEAMNRIRYCRIKSKTARGSSEISLYFDWGVDVIQVPSWSGRDCLSCPQRCLRQQRFATSNV